MNILLTGATGFLGSHLLRAFLRSDYQITILKRSFSDIRRIKKYLGKIKSFDIDQVPLERPFEECGKFDCVVHTATNYGRKGETASDVFDANLSFPLHLLNTSTFFNTSTFLNTSTILYPCLNYYSLSKRQLEDWGKLFANQRKIQFINVKMEHIYGPGDDLSKFTTWIVRSCFKNIEKLDLTPGEQNRDFIYIDDVIDAYKILLKKSRQFGAGFQEFALGSGKTVTIREFVETVKKLTGADTKLIFGAKAYREHETMASKANISRLLELGWKQKYDLITGLRKMIEVESKELL